MILLALAIVAQTQAKPNCDNPDTQADMNICADIDFRAADQTLNKQWKVNVATMKVHDKAAADLGENDGRPSYYETLLEGQRAWLKYRDAHCNSEGYWARGGTLEPALELNCLARLTRARTKELQDLDKGIGN